MEPSYHERGTRVINSVRVRITEAIWANGARSFEVYRVDDDTDLTEDGCFDTEPTNEQIAMLLEGQS